MVRTTFDAIDTVPDPKIEHGRDVIIKVTACAICGSDRSHAASASYCKKGFFSGCERSNPNHKMAERLWDTHPRACLAIPTC
jgi:hypothetical protein